ncbi:hypothetical protein [Stakelama flava]|uniref:hypothetical protein n=1 Tax=Stakelama flava TaxID=2860338 RepID=UPI001C5BD289|nr:hypothetical protein [Stakelama flava]
MAEDAAAQARIEAVAFLHQTILLWSCNNNGGRFGRFLRRHAGRFESRDGARQTAFVPDRSGIEF